MDMQDLVAEDGEFEEDMPLPKDEKKVKEEGKEEEVECPDNVFIDNLPKDEQSIRVLLKEVNRHIRELEKQFFEEEDSEAENEIKE
jgi:hypothetical protein